MRVLRANQISVFFMVFVSGKKITLPIFISKTPATMAAYPLSTELLFSFFDDRSTLCQLAIK